MIRINLLSLREAEREELLVRQRRRIVLGASAAVVFLLAAEVGSRLQLRPIRAEHARLQAELVRLTAESKEIRVLDSLQRDLEEKLKTIKLLEDKKVGPVKVLADLSDAIPDPLWLLDFTENGGAATVTGLALDNQTIATFMRNLSASPFFADVDLSETTQSEQNGVPLKKFVVNARLSYAGKQLPPAPANLKYPNPPKQPGQPRQPGRARKENRA